MYMYMHMGAGQTYRFERNSNPASEVNSIIWTREGCLSPARFGLAQLGPAQPGPAWHGSARLGSARLGLAQLYLPKWSFRVHETRGFQKSRDGGKLQCLDPYGGASARFGSARRGLAHPGAAWLGSNRRGAVYLRPRWRDPKFRRPPYYYLII